MLYFCDNGRPSANRRRASWLLAVAVIFTVSVLPIMPAYAVDNNNIPPITYYDPVSETTSNFFPIGWYTYGSHTAVPAAEPGWLTSLANTGSNTALLSIGVVWSEAQVQTVLAEAESLGMKIVISFADYSSYDPGTPGDWQPITDRVNALKGSPAILGWIVADEYASVGSSYTPAQVAMAAQTIAAADPNRMIWQDVGGYPGPDPVTDARNTSYMVSSDVLLSNRYQMTVWHSEFAETAMTAYLNGTITPAELADTNSWPYVSITQGIGGELLSGAYRLPTDDEYRWKTFSAMASAGARGLLNWTYGTQYPIGHYLNPWYDWDAVMFNWPEFPKPTPAEWQYFRDVTVGSTFAELQAIAHAMEAGYDVGTVGLALEALAGDDSWAEQFDIASQLLLYDDQAGKYYLIITNNDDNNGGGTRDVTITLSGLPVDLGTLQVYVPETSQTSMVTILGGGSYELQDTLTQYDVILYELTPISVAGDVDGNGFVGGADMTQIIGNWGKTGATWADGDISGPTGVPDGFVGADDWTAVLTHWGTDYTIPEPVPEPATLGLLVLSGLALLTRQQYS